ncbi:MAG: divalent metal cation transporter [Actinomycetota bacterium]|nr:divalent metal cation transporter [Actinomycetota bacterium]
MTENARLLGPPGSAALDSAHEGDIYGALGTLRRFEAPAGRSLGRRLLTLAAIMGPGLIVMVGDNDAGGVATYAQAGQNYGTTLLWTLLLLVPVLVVAQEMVARLGAVTGVGHARLIRERFGRFWLAFSVGDLFVLNFLTLVTEFIGVDLGLSYFGVSPNVSVPLAAVGLFAMAATGSFRRWERFMFVFILTSLLMFPLAALAHPRLGPVVVGTVVPRVTGGFDATTVLFIIAIVGTTVAPWQLFFQQSNVVDKRITTRFLGYELADTVIGAVLTNVGAAALIVATAFAFANSHLAGHFASALTVAQGLAGRVSPLAGDFFAVILINAAILGASAVTLSTSYALGDSFGVKHSLHRKVTDAKAFYGSFAALVALAAGIVLIPGAPLGLITTGVQVLAGVLLPSAIVFLLLLCNDSAVLGPWVNTTRQNLVASLIVAVLVLLSLILTITTVFPTVPFGPLVVSLTALGALGLGVLGLSARRRSGRLAAERSEATRAPRDTWRMPALATLALPTLSAQRKLGLLALRVYLVVAVVLLAVKIGQVAVGG